MRVRAAILLLGAMLTGTASAASVAIGWSDLAHRDAAPAGLDGEMVTIRGFLLPVDREDDLVFEFLLVPWAGACSHVSQPPPDQVIRVTPSEPIRVAGSYEEVMVVGRLASGSETTQLFIMDGVARVTSGYSLGQAQVERVGPAPADRANPWKSLTR
ncbi:MAG: DUF3299 domain-containing protein [Rhizobiaceae bacterium]